MTNKLSTELEILIKNLGSLNAPVLKLLNPPANESQLINFFNEYFPHININEDIKDMFLWHNGTTTDYTNPARTFHLFPGFYFNSVEETQGIMHASEPTYKLKECGFLPFFSSGYGEYLALSLKDYSNKPETTPIYYLSTWNPELELYTTMYDSLYQMFVTVNECFKRKIFFVDDKGLIKANSDQNYELSRAMNPNSDYWKCS